MVNHVGIFPGERLEILSGCGDDPHVEEASPNPDET
jgi:hypothetical protein